MPTYRITDKQTGKVYKITGERPPIQSEVEELIMSTLPKASAEERVLANTLYTGDTNARKSYLMGMGKSPKEPGWFYDEPGLVPKLKELRTDVLETGLGAGSKLGAQIAGESVGAAGGAVGGVPGAVLGYIGGGAAGRGLVQAAAENYAKMRGMEPADSRVAREAVVGGVTSAAGRLLQSGGAILSRLPGVKKAEQFLLTNVTRMARPMQAWVKGRWNTVYKTAKEPFEKLAEYVNTKVINPMKSVKQGLGRDLGRVRQETTFSKAPDYTGLGQEVVDVAKNYATTITKDELATAVKLAANLERSAAIATSKANTGTKEGLLMKTKATKMYWDALDQLLIIRRKIAARYDKMGGKAMDAFKAPLSFFDDVLKRINNRAKTSNPDLAKALDDYAEYMKVYSEFEDLVGKDKKTILRFMENSLFKESDPDIYGRQVVNEIFTKYLPKSSLDEIKDLVAASFMHNPDILTAGVKTGVAMGAGSLAGAGIGALTGGAEGARRGASTGAKIGLGVTLPFSSPVLASWMYRTLETSAPLVKILASKAPLLLASPLVSTINDVSNRFGIEPTEEDFKQLKSSRTKALK